MLPRAAFVSLALAALSGCGSVAHAPHAALPAPAPRAASAAYEGELRVREWGDRASPPLVLVHGLGANASADFEPVAEALAEGFHVIALDLPGFGGSPAAGHSLHPVDDAALIARWMREHLRRPAHLLGHSMGGAIAILVAGAHPELVERLVLVDVAGVLHREAFVSSQLGEAGGGGFESLLGAVRRFEPDPGALASVGAIVGGPPEQVAALSLIATDVGPALSSIRAPTLVVWGRRDRVAPLRTGRLLDDRIGHARLVVLDDAGHVPMADAPEAFVAEVRRHLSGASPAASRSTGASPRPFTCRGQADVELTGRLGHVLVEGCRGVRIHDARLDSLVIRSSDVRLDNVQIGGRAEVALDARDANVRATGGAIVGDVGASLHDSRLDLAGVHIEGRRVAFQTGAPSRVLFSVCEVRSGGAVALPHGNVVLGR